MYSIHRWASTLCSRKQRPMFARLRCFELSSCLRLERACLPHLRKNHLDGFARDPIENVSGHVFSASFAILHNKLRRDLNSTYTTMPAVDLERLLDTCRKLNLEGEVTPVQIWDRVCKITAGMTLTVNALHRVINQISPRIECPQ